MPIRSIDELRNWAGPDWKSASDEDLISMYSRAAKVPPTEVAMTLGYDPGSGGIGAKQISSSVDRYQAGLYGVGEAVTGAIGLNKTSGWLAEQRRANELQADVASARAREMGAVDTWKDVKDVGDFGSYAKSLAIQSLPYAGEAVVGGLAARGLMSGTRAALTGAKTVEEAAAAKRALDIGSTAGGVAASYPSAVGDILSNQREQAGGKTDLLAAGGLAIPYAGLNALGIDSALMRGGVFRNTINLLDRPGGLLGAATRTVATGTGVALKEGISETGQEVLNQAGRMAVDPNATLTDPEALERYKEAFAGGATLGGIMGGGLGGWRRSNPATNEIQQAFEQPNVSGTPTTNAAPPAAPPAPQQNVPAVVGGTTDIAQAQQQAQIDNQAAQIQQQQAEQTQAIQAQRDSVASYFGAEPAIENGKLVGGTIFGKSYADPEKFNAELDKLAQNESVKTETRRAVEKAYMDSLPPEKRKLNTIQSGALQFWANKPDIAAAAAAINEAMSELVVKGKGIDDPKVTQFAQMYEALTGTEAPAYDAATKVKPKGAKNGKLPLQTTTGLGTVPVQGGTGEANATVDGNVQPSGVQPLGTGSLPEGSLGLQVGQPSGEGIRTGTSAVSSVVDGNAPPQVTRKPSPETNQLLRQIFGDVNEITEVTNPATEGQALRAARASVRTFDESKQTKEPPVVTAVSEGVGGSRQYEIPTQYYNTDIMHISPERRGEIILQLFRDALAPQTETAATLTAEDRVEIVTLSLMEGMTALAIAAELSTDERTVTADAVQKQRQRLGITETQWGLSIDQSKQAGRDFMASLLLASENFKSSEFPDGLSAAEVGGLYSAKDLYYSKDKLYHSGVPVQEETEQRTVNNDIKLQEELYKNQEGAEATQSAGEIKTAGGAQGNIDSLKQSRKGVLDMGALDQINALEQEAETLRAAIEEMAPKDPRLSALEDRLESIGDIDSGELGALWAQYAKAQALRTKSDKARNVAVVAEEETAATEELTGEEIAASEREDERKKEAAEKAKADTEGTKDAVQESSAEEVPVREGAAGGKAVGKGNAKRGKAAGKAEVKQEAKPEEIKTPAEEWADISKLAPELPSYDLLAKSEKTRWDDLVRRGQANLAAAVKIVGEKPQPASAVLANEKPETTSTDGTAEAVSPKFGSDKAVVKNPYTAAELIKEIQDFVRADILDRKLVVVDSIEDLLNSRLEDLRALAKAISDKGAYGVAADGTAYLIANRISKGQGRAKFMHEVGAHLGLENLLPEAAYNKLVDQLERWAEANDGSVESDLANKAKARVGYAATPTEDQRNELLAYFVEEAMLAGIDPTATEKESGPLYAWFRTLWAAFKVAVRKLGFKPEKLTAQDVVNMAYGAARLEMSGSWHGTAASFRKFNHAFMSSGEGAQAYGWGTYLAQAVGIGKGYWEADIERKRLSGYEKSLAPYRGYTVAMDIINPIDRTLEIFKGFELTKNSSRVVARRLSELGVDYIELASPDGKVTTVQVGGPAGNLMRLDVAVPIDEMIDWDAPFADQPKVVLDFIKNEAPTIKDLRDRLGLKIQIRSGADVLKYLIAKFSLERNIVGEDAWKNATPEQRMEVKKEASKYLEANGIHGIRLLDANSRELTLDTITFTKDGKTISGRNAVLKAYFTPGAIVQGYGGPDKVIKFDPVKELITVIAVDNNGNPRRGERERTHFTIPSVMDVGIAMQQRGYDIGAANRTRNLVIFNEKNILRVGSEAAADKQRMKFGVNAPSTVDNVINALPKPLQKSAREQWTNIKTLAKRGMYASAITEDVVNMAKKYMPSAAKYLQAQYARQGTRLEFEKRIEDILSSFDRLPENLKGTGKGSVNEYIHDSTREKKWGYYPGEQQIGTTLFEVDPDLEKRFKAFPPAAQRVIKDVFRHGYEALKLKQQAAENAVNREFESREKAAGNDADLLQSIAKEKKQMLKRMTSLRNVDVSNPYAYLGRYGDYVVIAKSKEFIAYEEAATGTRSSAKGDSIIGDPQQAKNWLQDNVSNPLHYVVQFAETQGEADSIAEELQATGQYDVQPEDAGIKEANASYIGNSDVHMAVARLRNLANRQSDSTDARLEKAISDLYLMTVSEASARRSELERKNVSGADKNMMRNLATSGRADAHFLSTMEHSDELNAALEAMRDQARNNRKDAMPLYNELYTRYADSMEYSQPSVLAQNLLRMSTLWNLSTSPAYYLQQVLQTSVLSLPYMAGRLGYFRSARAIKRAYGDMSDLVAGLGINDHIDFDKAPADVRFMLKELVRMGKIDIGIDADAKARTDDQGPLGKVMFKLQGVNTRIEAINRATAAIAAYRGYVDRYKGATGADGVRFAAEVVSNTHGNYDGFNTPRILQSGGAKVLLQFKRFQIIQLSMLAKLIHTSFKGANAQERAIARASLRYITAHMAVLGGALGVPFVSQAASILSSIFGDDDEPDDYEYKLRRMIGDDAVADLLLRGVPAALGLESIGKRLSMENVASPFGPFVEFNITSRADAAQMIVGMMGPTVGLGLKFADALGMMSKGDYYKGLELALPNGIANAMKGYRFATEGITMRNGDLVMKPEEISMIDAAFQAVGLPTTTITDRQYTQKVVAEFDKFYASRAGEIKSSYVEGSRQSDAAAMAEARDDWQKLQESRVRNGYKRQSMSELFRAPAEARKRERGVVGGVETTKSNRRFVEQQVNQ